MRNLLLVCLLVLGCTWSTAQTDSIRMPERPTKKALVPELSHQKSGYWCTAEFSAGSTAMMNQHNSPYIGASFSNGYRLNEYLKLGVGIGCNWWVLNSHIRESDISLTLPLYACARGNFLPDILTSSAPYWDIKVGSAVGDGFFFSPSIGMRFGESRSAFTVSVGYAYRDVKRISDHKSIMHCAELHLGYEF